LWDFIGGLLQLLKFVCSSAPEDAELERKKNQADMNIVRRDLDAVINMHVRTPANMAKMELESFEKKYPEMEYAVDLSFVAPHPLTYLDFKTAQTICKMAAGNPGV
jgi:hypothetical protein